MQNNTVKTLAELQKIHTAAEITDKVFDYILGELVEGVTEKQIADKILAETIRLGASGVSFDTIVAFGASGCEPHHVPTDKPLTRGQFVTIDMGAVYEGYCSDFTRTVAFGEVSDEEKHIYEIVRYAYLLAAATVADGVECFAVDKTARDYIALCGYGDHFIHGTGHGIGMLIHEPPTMNATSIDILAANQVVTVEPGIYVEGRFGVRIENMLTVGIGQPHSRHSIELLTIN